LPQDTRQARASVLMRFRANGNSLFARRSTSVAISHSPVVHTANAGLVGRPGHDI